MTNKAAFYFNTIIVTGLFILLFFFITSCDALIVERERNSRDSNRTTIVEENSNQDTTYIAHKDIAVMLFGKEYKIKKGQQVTIKNGAIEIGGEQTISSEDSSRKSTFVTTFDYTPTVPSSNGVLKGIVELGATGYNYFIIRVDKRKNWKLEDKAFGRSFVIDGGATQDDVTSKLRTSILNIHDFGVAAKNIHFIVSSGASKNLDIEKKIIPFLQKDMNYVVNKVTPEQEAKYAFNSVIPHNYPNKDKCFVIDIGSSNTKVAWYQNNEIKGIETDGSKYKLLNRKDEDVYTDVQKQLAKVPESNNKMCFIIGGIPHKLAKKHRSGEERYTCLKAPQSYTAKGNYELGGLNIYRAIADETNCKHFVFDWETNFAIGFLISLPY